MRITFGIQFKGGYSWNARTFAGTWMGDTTGTNSGVGWMAGVGLLFCYVYFMHAGYHEEMHERTCQSWIL
jgi:hypothetical protein